MKKYIAAILLLAVVLIVAGWGLMGRGPEATEAGQSDLIINPRINEPDYPLDGKLFHETFGETMKSRVSNEVPDYPLDGKLFQDAFVVQLKSRVSNEVPDYPLDGRIFNEFFLEGTHHHESVDYPDFPLDGKFFVENYSQGS